MSCPTPPLLIPAPHLAQKPVQDLLALFIDELPWLNQPYGLVQPGVKKDGNKTYRYPQLYRQDGSAHSTYALPNIETKALCFFERNGLSEIDWHEDSMQKSGTWRHPVELVIWANLERIDNRGYDYAEELAADVLRVLIGAGVPVSGVDQRADRALNRYTFTATDAGLLLFPWVAFRIPLALSEPFDACAAPFQVLTQPGGCTPDLRA